MDLFEYMEELRNNYLECLTARQQELSERINENTRRINENVQKMDEARRHMASNLRQPKKITSGQQSLSRIREEKQRLLHKQQFAAELNKTYQRKRLSVSIAPFPSDKGLPPRPKFK